MGRDLETGCGCGAELRSLEHLFLNCPLLLEGRPGFFGFLACRFPGLPPDQFDYRELLFDPDPCVVSELWGFFKHGNLIIWVLGTSACEGCRGCLASRFLLLLCGEFGLDWSFGTPLVLPELTTDSCYLLPTYWFLGCCLPLAVLLTLRWPHFRMILLYYDMAICRIASCHKQEEEEEHPDDGVYLHALSFRVHRI